MMKRWMKMLWITFISLLMIVNTSCSQGGEPLPEDVLAKLDPEKITACRIRWWDENGLYISEESDPERVRAMYDALCHMNVEQEERNTYMGASYTILSFVQNGEDISVFSKLSVDNITHIFIGDDYAATIINENSLDKEYGWFTIWKDMRGQAEKVGGGIQW